MGEERGERDRDAEYNTQANTALFGNSVRAMQPWVRATGFRTHGFRHCSLSHSGDPRLAEDFLLNTRYLRHDRETDASIQSYFLDPGVLLLSNIGFEEKAGRTEVALPGSIRLRRELGDTIKDRRSRRSYTGDPIELAYVATLVRAAGAVTALGRVDLMNGGQ